MKERITGLTKNKLLVIMMIITAVIIAVVIIIDSVPKYSGPAQVISPEAIEEGRSYIRAAEALDTAEIENNIFARKKQEMLDEVLLRIEEDPDQVWQILSEVNTVIMGDSRALGFSVFEWMDESRVLAEGGDTIREIRNYYDLLSMINPNLVVLAYGLNDIYSYWYWTDFEQYKEEFIETMTQLTELLPNAYIYVQSTIPAVSPGLDDNPDWGQIPARNEALREICYEYGWRYLDITDLTYIYSDYYEIDGVHMMTYFYPHWARAILERYMTDVINDTEIS